MRIFFADPHPPWQRWTNEDTNGLLRQYFPKGTSFAGIGQEALDAVAASLNDRSRKTLDFATTNEQFSELLAKLAYQKKPQPPAVRYENGIRQSNKLSLHYYNDVISPVRVQRGKEHMRFFGFSSLQKTTPYPS